MAHSTASHAAPRRRGWAVRLGGAVVAVTLVAGAVVAALTWDDLRGSAAGCRDQVLSVSADPRIAGVVAEATQDLGPWLKDGDCLKVEVTTSRSSTTAAELARPTGQGLSAALPDVWIPDSSLWLALAQRSETGASRMTAATVSIATSPVVIAMPASRAEELGWPDTQPTWQGLLESDDTTLRLAATDPREDAPGLSSVLSLVGDDGVAALVAVSRRLAVPALGKGSAAGLVARGTVDAIPAAEQDVILANGNSDGPESLAAAYDPALSVPLDFPLVLVSRAGEPPDKRQEAALEVLSRALLDPTTQDLLATSGLRRTDGTLSSAYGARQGVNEAARPAPEQIDRSLVESVVSNWGSLGRRSNLLVVVDRSASMGAALPGTEQTKAQLAQDSLLTLVNGIAPDSELGLWSFVTGLADEDAQELVPLGPVNEPVDPESAVSRRETLSAATAALTPLPGGGTPLYDSVLEAYRAATANFTYGRLNAVLVVTDGRNEDAGSISLAKLIDTLRAEYDGVRPVRIVTAAYGVDADNATLRRIADVTGGRSYQALTADEVGAVFASVLAEL